MAFNGVSPCSEQTMISLKKWVDKTDHVQRGMNPTEENFTLYWQPHSKFQIPTEVTISHLVTNTLHKYTPLFTHLYRAEFLFNSFDLKTNRQTEDSLRIHKMHLVIAFHSLKPDIFSHVLKGEAKMLFEEF